MLVDRFRVAVGEFYFRIKELEKDLYYYKKVSRDLKKALNSGGNGKESVKMAGQ